VLPDDGLRHGRRLCHILCWRCLLCLLGLAVTTLLLLLLRGLRQWRGSCLLHQQS
jgi:hypothetical protein